MFDRQTAITGRLARAAARPLERVAQTLRGDGIDDMRFNGEQLLLRRVLPRLGPQPVVFDVGANVGRWTRWVSAHTPAAQLHAFEPDPRAHGQLERKTGHLSNVHRHRLALGSKRAPPRSTRRATSHP